MSDQERLEEIRQRVEEVRLALFTTADINILQDVDEVLLALLAQLAQAQAENEQLREVLRLIHEYLVGIAAFERDDWINLDELIAALEPQEASHDA